ncbi:MAG: hypothetical protein LBU82_06465 [Treponema sp.]|jgi:hypothetical protein|nr:hypothetical protein [Treponema sp.]
MAIKFNHKALILMLRDEFPKYLEKSSVKIEWGKGFAKNDFRDSFISGKGNDEKLVLLTEIIINAKNLPVSFIEDKTGALTIEINGKTVFTVKPKGRISQNLLKAFTNSITGEL